MRRHSVAATVVPWGLGRASHGHPMFLTIHAAQMLDDDDDKIFEATELRSFESAAIRSCAMSLKHSTRLGIWSERRSFGWVGGWQEGVLTLHNLFFVTFSNVICVSMQLTKIDDS